MGVGECQFIFLSSFDSLCPVLTVCPGNVLKISRYSVLSEEYIVAVFS